MKPSALPAFPEPLPQWNEIPEDLAPDQMLPVQFYAPAGGASKTMGGAALMIAVLEDAIGCFQKQSWKRDRHSQRLGQEAEAWLFSDDLHWPFSFVNICTALGLQPEYVRRGLRQWQAGSHRAPPLKRRRTVISQLPLKVAA